MDHIFTATEYKFVTSSEEGEFEGYGSFFGNQDSHGDVVAPGAFKATLEDHARKGSMPSMLVMHGGGLFGGGPDSLPIGRWKSMSEDTNGLALKGRLSALDTDYGKRVRGLMKDGALGGLSIGFSVPKNGATYGDKPGEPRRTLKTIKLHEVSVVDRPSNERSIVANIKSRLADGDVPTIRELEEGLREQFGFSRSQAAQIVERGFKSMARDEPGGEKPVEVDWSFLGRLSA